MTNDVFSEQEGVYIVLVRSRLQDLISPVGVSRENAPVLSVSDYGLSGVATACRLWDYSLSWEFPVLS